MHDIQNKDTLFFKCKIKLNIFLSFEVVSDFIHLKTIFILIGQIYILLLFFLPLARSAFQVSRCLTSSAARLNYSKIFFSFSFIFKN